MFTHGTQGKSSSLGGRSVSDKEKTKMRERQRRAITTKIFHGLRKHGGYKLSPRADINQVLRELAKEAGWVVEPDGTTYRSNNKVLSCCHVCGYARTSATPSSSIVIGGESSSTVSPRRAYTVDCTINVASGHGHSLFLCGVGSGGSGSGSISNMTCSERDKNSFMTTTHYMNGGGMGDRLGYQHHQQLYMQEARASNQNTPMGSPLRRA